MKTGPLGMISMEPYMGPITELVTLEGGVVNKGYSDVQFAKDGSSFVNFKNPLILISDLDMSELKMIIKPLEYAKKVKRPLIIIAPRVHENCMKQLLFNVHKNTIECICLEMFTPGNWFFKSLLDLSILFDSLKIDLENKHLLLEADQMVNVLGEAKEFTVGILESSFVTKEQKTQEHLQKIKDHTKQVLCKFNMHSPKYY